MPDGQRDACSVAADLLGRGSPDSIGGHTNGPHQGGSPSADCGRSEACRPAPQMRGARLARQSAYLGTTTLCEVKAPQPTPVCSNNTWRREHRIAGEAPSMSPM